MNTYCTIIATFTDSLLNNSPIVFIETLENKCRHHAFLHPASSRLKTLSYITSIPLSHFRKLTIISQYFLIKQSTVHVQIFPVVPNMSFQFKKRNKTKQTRIQSRFTNSWLCFCCLFKFRIIPAYWVCMFHDIDLFEACMTVNLQNAPQSEFA